MADEPNTFGTYITFERKKMGLSQKQLAELIEREEGGAISAQYLNDIEHDRRSPSSDHMIQEFARVLKVGTDHLYYLAGRVPADVRDANLPPKKVEELFAAFRRTTPPKRNG
jgi:transcriptional regulator with XRE-family HTH domain